MSKQDLLGEVTVIPNAGISVKMRFPKRGLAGILVFIALMGGLIMIAGVMVSSDKNPPGPIAQLLIVGCGLAIAAGCGLSAIYFFTRWQQVRIDHGEIFLERGWCLGRSTRRHRLSNFRGLHRYARQLGAMDGASAAGSLIGVAAAAVTGVGVVAGKTVTFHFLELVHHQDKSQNVLLTGSRNASALAELADSLSGLLQMPLLTPTLDGYADQERPKPLTKAPDRQPQRSEVLRDPEIGTDWCRLAGTEQKPAVPSSTPPQGIDATSKGSITTVFLPASRTPLVAGCTIAAIFGAIGVLCITFLPEGKWRGGIPLAISLPVLLVGSMNSRRRNSIVLTSAGLQYKMAAIGTQPLYIPWTSIGDVSVASSSTGKPGLLVVTDGPEAWLAVGQDTVGLHWLRDTVRDRSRVEALRRSQSQPDAGRKGGER